MSWAACVEHGHDSVEDIARDRDVFDRADAARDVRPELSREGRLTAASIPYEVGISRYRELARGQTAGDTHGMLKLLVSSEYRSLLGVHVFGTGATENVHIGQAVMGCGAPQRCTSTLPNKKAPGMSSWGPLVRRLGEPPHGARHDYLHRHVPEAYHPGDAAVCGPHGAC